MKIDIHTAPPTLKFISATSSKRKFVRGLWLILACCFMSYYYYTRLLSHDLPGATGVLTASGMLLLFARGAQQFLDAPYTPITDDDCAIVRGWVKDSERVRHYVRLVQAQNREIIGAEYNAFAEQITLEETTKNKRALYQESF